MQQLQQIPGRRHSPALLLILIIKKLRPTHTRGHSAMKKVFLAMAALVLAGTAAYAQKKSNLGEVMFQEASAREASPTVNFFVFPQICDLQMLSNQREDYGPYDFPMAKDLSTLTNQELENVKTRALQKACALAGADLMLEPFYTSTVYDKDNRVIWVSISGFPAKYTNFRSLAEKDILMLQKLYPNGIPTNNAENIITAADQGAK